MRKSEEQKFESLGCVAQEPQCGHVRQEMEICKLELFRFYVCIYLTFLLAEQAENWTFPHLWNGTEVGTDVSHVDEIVTESSKML